MKDEEILKLIRAFDEQQEVIKKQSTIIDQLYGLLAQHISTGELKEITETVRLMNDDAK